MLNIALERILSVFIISAVSSLFLFCYTKPETNEYCIYSTRLIGRADTQGRSDILTFAGFGHLLSRPLLGLQQLLDALGLARHVEAREAAVSGVESWGAKGRREGRMGRNSNSSGDRGGFAFFLDRVDPSQLTSRHDVAHSRDLVTSRTAALR